MTTQLAKMRRAGASPIAIFVYVGKPPKWVVAGPGVIVVDRNPRAMDWRPVVGLHVDVVEVGDQGALLAETVKCVENAKAKSIGLLCRAGIAGINQKHEELLQRLQRRLNAFPQ